MNDEYLAGLFSQNVGKKAYIKYHRSGSSDCSSVEGVMESCNAKARVVVLSSESGVVHFGYSTVYVETVSISPTEKTA